MRDALRMRAERHGQKTAAISADGSERLDYLTLDASADRVAAHLRRTGILDGQTVALLCDGAIDVLKLWWGARRAGAYYVTLPTTWTTVELAHILRTCSARIVLASSARIAAAREAVSAAGLTDVEVVPMMSAVDRQQSDRLIDDVALIGRELIFSSGTTGRPRGIRRPLADASRSMELPELERRMREIFHIGPETVYLSVAPLHHATGRFLMRVTEEGGTVVLLSKFDAISALAAIERHRVTNTQWVPTMFVRLLSLSQAERDSFDLSSQRHALHAAAPCPADVKRAMIEWFGPIVDEYYGGTENAGVTFIAARDWLHHPGSVGRSIAGAIHVLDEADPERELPPGEIGLITFEGGVPFTYLEEDASSVDVDPNARHAGYGDLGWLDAEGYLYISDRRSDLIVTGGVNVYPREVELVLENHPAVAEVAVIGVPDPAFGQRVHAVVVTRPEHRVGMEELTACARLSLAPVKQPRSIEFASGLPRNENGKLLKRVLRERFAPDAM